MSQWLLVQKLKATILERSVAFFHDFCFVSGHVTVVISTKAKSYRLMEICRIDTVKIKGQWFGDLNLKRPMLVDLRAVLIKCESVPAFLYCTQ